ncbi:MAG: class I SAM-dependent methyltransferase [Proteobacteria bacterium]|nr:class I SAM-dependent methyltransferase [Pseudomonadota bacterium]
MARYRAFDWYATPLYYDIVFDAETDKECDFLEAMYERHAPGPTRRVLEPACGSGRLVVEMARRGYHVTGFDLSDSTLEFAKKRLERARRTRSNAKKPAERSPGRVRLHKGLMQSFRFRGQFDLAHCLVSSFRYLLSEDDALSHLECTARALRPGGIYVLGFHLSEYVADGISRERWVAERNGVHVVCNIQSWPAERHRRRESLRSRLVVSRRGRVTRHETSWEFRTYSARQFRSLVAKVPNLEHIATYDFDYNPDKPCRLGAERLDQVAILRRR